MGLPLFVAPVESDLPSKATDKSGAASPSRSGIRRHGRLDPRERRAALRRHMSIRDGLTNGSLRQSSSLSSRGADQFSIRNEPAGTDSLRRPRPFREVLREVNRSDVGTRDRIEDQLQSLFGMPSYEREEGDEEMEEMAATLGWWGVGPISQNIRNRMTQASSWNPTAGPESSQQDRDDSRPRSRQRYPALPSFVRPMSETDSLGRRRRTVSRAIPLNPDLNSGEDRRNMLLQRVRSNGLGDRERSLSPEVWDTLLTTLTPDPQPPSAGSSFASTVASQSAGVSSNTSRTTPGTTEGETADQACESGCENSDTEGADYVNRDFARMRRRREAMRVRVRVPDWNLDGPVDGPLNGSRETSVSALRSLDRPSTRLTPSGSSSSNRRAAGEEPTGNTVGHGNLTLSQFRTSRHGWVGHLSVGTSDDELGADRRGLNRESSATSGNNTSPGEEDWAGMQHIVRSLARREDIPDEWWAEAGLSRNFQDGTE